MGARGEAVTQLHAVLQAAGYRIAVEELQAAAFGESTRAAVATFQRAHQLEPTGAVDAPTNDLLRRVAGGQGVPAGGAPPDPGIVVRGTALLADHTPYAGAVVQLVAQGVRSARPLTRVATDAQGRFSARLERAQLRSRGQLEDGLLAQALDSQGRVVAQSDPLFRIGQIATVQLVVSAQAVPPPSEYAKLRAAALSALDEGMTLAGLTKTQVVFIARQTGFRAQHMSALSRAEQGAAQWGISVPLLYACARQGLSSQVTRLASAPPQAIRAAVTAAVAAGQVPPVADAEIEAALARLQQARTSHWLDTKADERSASLADLLTLAQVPPAAQQTVATHADTHGLGSAAFSKALADDKLLSQDQVAAVGFAVQVAGVTGGYLPLIQEIMRARQAGQIRSVADLARMDESTWERLLLGQAGGRALGTPAGTQGQSPEEQARTYAQSLTQALAQAFPTAAFAGTILRQGLPGKPQARDHVARFLTNNPDFDLGTDPLPRYVAAHSGALTGISDPTAFQQDMASIQRAYRLAPKYEHVNALLQAGLDSAHKVTRLGRDVFAERFAPALGADVHSVYNRATQIVATTTHLLTQQTLQTFEDTIPSLQTSSVSVAARQLQEELFGSLDFCACEDCRSVLSPAAYLADLLAWLAGRKATVSGLSALDVLLDRGTVTLPPRVRRPDLAGIQLSCVNTNTPLPYIDLVNEVLEQAVAGPVPLPASFSVPQTTQSADELSVTPEHVNDNAYFHLSEAVFPPALPYDLYSNQAAAFLQGMKSSRTALLVATYPGDSATAYADPLVVRSELNLTTLAWNILTTADPTLITPAPIEPWVLWGIHGPTLQDPGGSGTTIDWYVALRYVTIFLQQAGIQYTDLLALLRASFMSASNLSLNPPSPCDLDTATIHNLDGAAATLAHRFLRLWRIMGGSIDDLDLMLSALSFTDITPAALTALANVKRLQTLFPKLAAWQLAVLWSPLSTRSPADDSASPYDALFQNPAVTTPLNPAFALNGAHTELATTGGAISAAANAAVVLAALNLATADLTAMLQPAGPVPDVMNLANLSYLVRISTLARALRLSIADFLALLPLIAVSPFDGANVANTVTWVQTAAQISAASLTAAQVVWLTEGTVPAAVTSQLSDAAIIAQLTTLAAQLQAASPGTDTSPLVKNAIWTMLSFPATYPLTLLSQLAQPVGGSPSNMLAYLQQLGATPPTLTPAQAIPSIRRLQQIALLVATSGVAMSDLPYLFNLNVPPPPALPTPLVPGLGWLDPNALPASNAPIAADPARLTRLLRLLNACRFCAGEHCTLQQLFSLFTFSGAKAGAQALIAGFTPWSLTDIQTLTGASTDGPLALPYPAAYQDERGLLRLKAAFDIAQAFNVSAARLLTWAVDPVTAAIAQDVRTAARAGFATEKMWVAAARPWQDTLREQQRNALVAYLCGRLQTADLTAQVDASTLYDEYLIDVSMNACMMTSRIKQAISSTQLFIQRAFMNMEPLVVLSDDDHQQWLWMQNYRVWEANRKVFLYPENWVLPELRDNKSPLFRDLETALLQAQLNNDNAEAALSDYLTGLYQISRLEMAGYFHQLETNSSGNQINVIHVIGGVLATPPVYFYRRYVDGSYWTAWEKIPLTIKSNHLVPIVYNRKLRLCWITVKTVKDANVPASAIQNSGSPPPMQWQLTLNWSEYHDGKWSSPQKADDPSQQLLVNQTSSNDYSLGRTDTVQAEADFFFQGFVESSSGDLVIRCFTFSSVDEPDGGNRLNQYTQQGDFHFAACQGTVSVVVPSSFTAQEYYPPDFAANVNQTFDLSDSGGLSAENPYLAVLGALPAAHPAVDYGHQFLVAPLPAPFFFRDDQRTFFAQPLQTGWMIFPWPPIVPWAPGPVIAPVPEPSSGSPYVDGAYPTDVVNALTQDAQQAHLQTVVQPGYRFFSRYQYRFDMAYHPWVCTFVEELERGGIDALYRRWVQVAPYILNPSDDHLTFFHDDYHPSSSVATPYPVADVDFRFGGAYALYNWELFYHVPMLVAKRLADNQQFEDALKWVERVFDPNDRTLLPAPHRFWRARPFFEAGASPSVQGLLALLDTSTPSDADARADLQNQIAQWRKSPFNPHLIARLRPSAYQKTAIMQYLDILIGWGDQLFSRNTIETINEAAQMYLAAAAILGPRPQLIPEAQPSPDQTFAQIRPALDAFSNALVTLENYVPSGDTPSVSIYGGSPPPPMPILYFCIPPNAKLLAYWDTIADRLFKIRNCENIAGVVQQLPLFEPPIDPALLVAATAAGLSIADVLNAISAPPPMYRFEVMIRRAHEMASAVSALGAKLLAALEHKDAKNLELLKSSQLLTLMQHVADVYQSKVDEAQQKIDALTASQQIQTDLASYYDTLTAIMFMVDAAIDFTKGLVIAGKGVQTGAHATGAVTHPLPNASAGTVAVAPSTNVEDGGTHAGHAADQAGKAADAGADLADKIVKYIQEVAKDVLQIADWQEKASQARAKADQIGKQIIAAQTALAIAQKELDNYNLQMDQAQAVDDFYHNEFTSADLYGWMVGQISAVYFQSYQVAYGVAQQAERTFRQELGLYPLESTSYITFGYWDSLHKGLLAGERLELDLRRMEAAYYQDNAREYEVTKKISLKAHALAAYTTLLAGGSCYVSFGEDLFDADYPFHYMRRIKVVNMGVTYTSAVTTLPSTINCTLTLAQDSIRTQPGRTGDPDVTHTVARSMVASTQQTAYLPSQSATYTGMFTIDFLKDERYFPFEGSGAISEWHILMPMSPSFASTVDDIWVQIKYTARGEPPIGSDPLVTAVP